MPVCSCGCNQNLSRRGIKYHLKRQAVPRLVTAVVHSSRNVGQVSPPRLNPAKKLRSSRRFLPSSPEPPPSVNLDHPMSDVDIGDIGDNIIANICEGDEIEEIEFDIDEAAVQDTIHHTLDDVWTGKHHAVSDNKDFEDADEMDSEDEDEDVEEDEEIEDEEYGLSAMDLLEEDFERDAVRNGKFTIFRYDLRSN